MINLKTYEDFKKDIQPIDKFADRKKYFQERYVKIGKGTSRIVYTFDADSIIKVAKNKKGIVQNLTESNPKILEKYGDIVAKVLDYDKNGKWLIQERARGTSETEFEKITGFQFLGFISWLRWKSSTLNDFYKDKEFPKKVDSFITEFNLDRYDVTDFSAWGVLNENKVVIRDYGLTIESARKLYGVNY